MSRHVRCQTEISVCSKINVWIVSQADLITAGRAVRVSVIQHCGRPGGRASQTRHRVTAKLIFIKTNDNNNYDTRLQSLRCHVNEFWNATRNFANKFIAIRSGRVRCHSPLEDQQHDAFLPCDAMRYTVFGIVILSVRPSVRPSVTLVDCVHMVRPTIMISSPHGSPIILVSGDITFIPKFEGGYPSEGVEWGWDGTNWRFSINKPPYLRNGARYDKGYY